MHAVRFSLKKGRRDPRNRLHNATWILCEKAVTLGLEETLANFTAVAHAKHWTPRPRPPHPAAAQQRRAPNAQH
jgi:hypothetical protein